MSEVIKGKAKGGLARAKSMSADKRKEIAKKAAKARWSKSVLKATHGAPDRPLKIGSMEIPCYVLEDEKRVLVHGGMLKSLDMKSGTAGRGSGDRLAKFASTKAINPFISDTLMEMIKNPIKFRSPSGNIAHGYEATILADICDAVLDARKNEKLHYQQVHIAERCEILIRGFARVGIIALVDEATGYQKDRARDSLAKILEAFVAKELQPWVKTFPASFYEEMFRLRGLLFPSNTVKRPQYFGHLTNDIIYRRLAPGVLEELKKKAEKNERNKTKHKLHQKLTPDFGHPKLRELVISVTTVMKLSNNWVDFKPKLDKVHPPYNETLKFPFMFDGEIDTGEGF